jgi:anti-sigma B factor antagonist
VPAKDLSIDPVEEGAGGVRLVLSGELDMACTARLTDAIDEHARKGTTLVVDLSGLEFMDSSGLAALLKAQNAAESDGWDMAVKSPPAPVDRIFDLTDTRRLLNFVES